MASTATRFPMSMRLVAGVALGSVVIAAATGVAEAKRKRYPRALYRNPLVLTSFVQDGRLDVHRNEILQFKFSAIVKAKTVDARSVRILQQTSAGTKQAIGALSRRGNVVLFDSSRSQRNFDDSRRPGSQVTSGDNPGGFLSFTDFIVQIPGPPELHTLKNARGAQILQGFGGSFRTNGVYDDPVPGQPYFVGEPVGSGGHSGNLGFDPPRSGSTGLVDEDAIILIEFNEPVNVDTLDPSSTVLVTRAKTGEAVPGFIRLDPNDRSGRRFQFVPSLGFGSDIANQAGWEINVELTTGITDLAGNALKRPYVAPPFTTRYVPGKKSASIISETFANQSKMDPATIPDGGEWNTLEKGALLGGAATSFPPVDASYWLNPPGVAVAFFRANDPLIMATTSAGCIAAAARPMGSRTQMFYVPSDVAEAAAIVSVGWGPSSNALFGSNYPEVTLGLGHTSNTALVADFKSNVNVGGISQVYRGPYLVPQAKNIQPSDGVNANGVTPDPAAGTPRGYHLWPTFTSPFEWNGQNNLVFDAAVLPGTTCQILRAGFVAFGTPFPARRAIGTNYTSETADYVVETSVYDIRFNKRRRTTKATSLWYELSSDNPAFADPIVSPVGQPGGVTVLVELEGAPGKADPLNPGGYIPNTTSATGFTTDITQIDGHRFFRFRVTMVANLNSNQSARVTSVQFPYQF